MKIKKKQASAIKFAGLFYMGEMPAKQIRGGQYMTRKTIEIEQKLERKAPGHFHVTIKVIDNGEVLTKEYTYYRTNRAFPSYKSLISVLRKFEEVDVVLRTDYGRMISEINEAEDERAPLAKMLIELLIENNITIKAV